MGRKVESGVDQAYALALPTYGGERFFYHKKLPVQPPALAPFLAEVEQYAMGGYMRCAAAGDVSAGGSEAGELWRRRSCTGMQGLPVAFLLRSNLRVSGGAFSKNLELEGGDDDGAAGYEVARGRT